MNVPQRDIQFANTVDGVGVGYWEIGAGPPLVLAQSRSLSHAELEWRVPSMAALYIELAKYFRLIRFDPRGAGVSDEPPLGTGVSIDGLFYDLDAVVEALDLAEFNLVGAISMGPVAIKYAVAHPKRVSGLILCDTGASLTQLPIDNFVKATDAVIPLDVVPSFSGLFNSPPSEDMRALEELMRGSIYNRQRFEPRNLDDHDVSQVLDQVRTPTLVIRSRESVFTDQAQIRHLVANIPGAQMRIVPGAMAPWLADLDSVVEAFVSFLTSNRHYPASQTDSELLAVVFTDLVSSTEVLSRLGDDEGRREIREVERSISDLCSVHDGRLVKNLGDGSLITFKSTKNALTFSLDIQARMATSPFNMRIGVSAGEPMQEDDDIHGAVVVQASRITDLTKSGEIVVADSIRQLAIGKGFSFEPRGEVRLKGFDEDTTIWKVAQGTST